jgi:nicotinamidase-related amidase
MCYHSKFVILFLNIPLSFIMWDNRLKKEKDMGLLNLDHSVVSIIDLQGKLMEMIYRPDLVVVATVRLLKLADIYQVPVILTEQYSKGLGKTHSEVLSVFDKLTTAKRYLDKTSFGCCGDPNFEKLMTELRPNVPNEDRQVVVAGIEAHICVMQTVLELLRCRNQVHVCRDCVSGRGEEYVRYALERMKQAGAVITNHESVGFEWARDKNHPGFKAMSNLFKG